MDKTDLKYLGNRLLVFCGGGLVLGFVFGFIIALQQILHQDFLRFGLFRLAGFLLRKNLIDCLLGGFYFSLVFFIGFVFWFLLSKKIKRLDDTRRKRSLRRLKMAVLGGCALIVFILVEYVLDYVWLAYRRKPVGTLFHAGVFMGLVGLVLVYEFLLKPLFMRFCKPAMRLKPVHFLIACGLLLLTVVLLNAALLMDGTKRPQGHSVIIILSDSLRQDHLGCYGYHRNTSPHIDRFAEDAALFENSYAQSPSTRPSVASIFTSLYPSTHGAIYNQNSLPFSCLTLAEVLNNLKYKTAAFVENPLIRKKYKYHQGFDTVRLSRIRMERPEHDADGFDEKILDWIDENSSFPFFLYVHFIDPHFPYRAPEDYFRYFDPEYSGDTTGFDSDHAFVSHFRRNPRDLEHLVSLYDDEIRYMDDRFEKIIRCLQEKDLYDKTLVIFVSDHGEEFLEHGDIGHSSSLFSEQIDVPLIMRMPGRFRPGRYRRPVQHIDLFPTILDVLGIETERFPLAGKVIRTDSDEAFPSGSLVVSEHLRLQEKWGSTLRSAIAFEWKLLQRIGTGGYSLFDLASDPGEKTDLYQMEPEMSRVLKSLLDSWEAARKKGMNPELLPLDREMRESLRTLGYIK
jgi:arylsulfatase A-like enzyme